MIGEYYDPRYFQLNDIIHETVPNYEPQSNRVAERKNRTLQEMINSMLSYSGLSKNFGGSDVGELSHIKIEFSLWKLIHLFMSYGTK